MTDLFFLQERVEKARNAWRDAFERGTEAEEAAAYRELCRLERELREAANQQTRELEARR